LEWKLLVYLFWSWYVSGYFGRHYDENFWYIS
jgi:hypothetical protein